MTLRKVFGAIVALVVAMSMSLGLASANAQEMPVASVFVNGQLGSGGYFSVDSFFDDEEDPDAVLTIEVTPDTAGVSGEYPIGYYEFGPFDPHTTLKVKAKVTGRDWENHTVTPYPVPFPQAPTSANQTCEAEGSVTIPDQTFNLAGGTLNVLFAIDGTQAAASTYSKTPGTYHVTVSLPGELTWPVTYTGPLSWDLTVGSAEGCNPGPKVVNAYDVIFDDVCGGPENDFYRVPKRKGVEYVNVATGEILAKGTYPGEGTVKIEARAKEGRELDKPYAWEHTFTNEPCGEVVYKPIASVKGKCVKGEGVIVFTYDNNKSTDEVGFEAVVGDKVVDTRPVAAGETDTFTHKVANGQYAVAINALDVTILEDTLTVDCGKKKPGDKPGEDDKNDNKSKSDDDKSDEPDDKPGDKLGKDGLRPVHGSDTGVMLSSSDGTNFLWLGAALALFAAGAIIMLRKRLIQHRR